VSIIKSYFPSPSLWHFMVRPVDHSTGGHVVMGVCSCFSQKWGGRALLQIRSLLDITRP